MKLSVEFNPKISSNMADYAMCMPQKTIGLDAIDKIREGLDVPKLHPDKIHYTIYFRYANPVIKISEETARESKHFKAVGKICVVTRPRLLNPFVHEQIIADKDPETGEVMAARIEYAINEEEVINAWQKAGFPLEWEQMLLSNMADDLHTSVCGIVSEDTESERSSKLEAMSDSDIVKVFDMYPSGFVRIDDMLLQISKEMENGMIQAMYE